MSVIQNAPLAVTPPFGMVVHLNGAHIYDSIGVRVCVIEPCEGWVARAHDVLNTLNQGLSPAATFPELPRANRFENLEIIGA